MGFDSQKTCIFLFVQIDTIGSTMFAVDMLSELLILISPIFNGRFFVR